VSYTTVEQVQSYLDSNAPIAERVRDQPVTLLGTTPVRFFGGAVDGASFVAKGIRDVELARTLVTLVAGPNQLSAAPIQRGSVVAASDSSLGTVYIENADFVVDYDAGTIEIRPGGSLEIGRTIVVWYRPCLLFLEGVDYLLDLARSEIRRVSSGRIASGETICLDYSPLFKDFTDELLTGAVNEANGLIEREVDPAGDFGADPRLSGAATCLALDNICRAAAMRVLASRPDDDRAALAWLKLSDSFAARAEQLVKSFRPPIIGPASPALS
jgi:hypothetical protein